MYKSPINIEMMTSRLIETAKKDTEENIYSAVMSYGVDVDKDELLRALAYDRGQYDEGFAAGYRAATPKWIPVEERLPAVGEDVLVITSSSDRNMAVWRLFGNAENRKAHWEDEVGDGLVLGAATHWMPLPQPPIEEQNRAREGEDG